MSVTLALLLVSERANKLFSRINPGCREQVVREIQCAVKEEEGEVVRVRGAGGREQRGRARIDHLPGVMDSAISGSGQRRRGVSDFCFSKS